MNRPPQELERVREDAPSPWRSWFDVGVSAGAGFLLALLLALAATGCAFVPEDAEPFAPPPEYRQLWDSAQACTGRTGRFEELQWFVTPDNFECAGGIRAGCTRGKTIILSALYKDHPMVVKHEMIHALGVRGHPKVPFERPCKATWESYRK